LFPPASARLGAARLIARRSATKLKTENKKIDDFGRDMINPPENSPVATYVKALKAHPHCRLFPTPENLVDRGDLRFVHFQSQAI
jgi:hypothetical protein